MSQLDQRNLQLHKGMERWVDSAFLLTCNFAQEAKEECLEHMYHLEIRIWHWVEIFSVLDLIVLLLWIIKGGECPM